MALTTVDSKGDQHDATQDTLKFQAHGQDRVELPSHAFISEATMTKDGDDLVLQTPDGQTAVIEGYFSADPAPLLQSPDGAALTPNLVDAFARSPAEFAANGTATDESPVGAVEEVKGNATVTRADGTVETVTAGTPIYQGDIIETDEAGAVNIVFIDETSMAISKNAKIAVDQYTFDPSSESGTTNLSVLRGLFVFTSGLIGRDDPDDVQIDTPVGSIGIRGTVIAGEINPGGESNISVLEGAIVVKNGSMEATLSQQFETIRLGGFDQPMKEMGVVPASEINTKFNSVGSVLPSLFSVIGETANEQGQQPQPQNQAPQTQAPSDDGAKADQAPQQTQEAAQQTQPAPEAPAPAPVQDIVTLDNNTNSGLPSSQTVAGQPSTGGTTAHAPVTAPTAPVTMAPPPVTAPPPPPVTNTPPPVVTQPTTTTPAVTALAIAFTATNLLDTADENQVVGTFSANSTGVSYKFANGTYTSDNGFYSIGTDGTVRLTAAGANHLHSSLETLQLGSFGVVAVSSDGRTTSAPITPVVHDANMMTLDLSNPAAAGVSHITDTINNQFGYSISALGDVDRDGFADFIVSNNSPTAGQNLSYLVHGQNGQYADGPLTSLGAMTPLTNPGTTLANLNTIVTGIGDYNGDGKDDYAVGQAGALIGAAGSGNAYIISGTGTTSDNITFLTGGVAGDQIGSSISGVGDFNNDGFADVIVGAPGASSGMGRTYLIKGGNSWTDDITNTASTSGHTEVTQGTTSSVYGASVRGVGDVNGDGYSDYAVGAPGGAGYVDIVYGHANGSSGPSTTHIVGAAGQGFGSEILSLGDINGDGYSDLLASGSDMSMRFIMGGASGGTAGATINLNGGGYEINGAGGIGDFNGDGFDDFAVSLANANETKLYVVYGKDGAAPILSFDYLKDPLNALEMKYNGANNTNELEISGIGDVNGDGRDDFAIGVPDLNGSIGGNGGIITVYGRDVRNDAPLQNAATANGQAMVGTVTANSMDDGNRTGVSMHAGAGEDSIILNNTTFRAIDGGTGYDTILANQNLDFSNVNFEQISGIEKLQFNNANTTITLTLENIFNMLKTSDGDTGSNSSGYLKITSAGLAGSKLIIDAGYATDIMNASSTQIDAALETYSGSASVTSTDTTVSTQFDTFKIGGYTLLIENNVAVDVH